MFLLLYFPLLLFLPLLLLLGIVFVVVPGGFIVVLAGAYYFASAGLIGLFGLVTKHRHHAIDTSAERSRASEARSRPATRTPATRTPAKRRAADAPSTAA